MEAHTFNLQTTQASASYREMQLQQEEVLAAVACPYRKQRLHPADNHAQAIHTLPHTCDGRSSSRLPSRHLRSSPLSPPCAEKVTISPVALLRASRCCRPRVGEGEGGNLDGGEKRRMWQTRGCCRNKGRGQEPGQETGILLRKEEAKGILRTHTG